MQSRGGEVGLGVVEFRVTPQIFHHESHATLFYNKFFADYFSLFNRATVWPIH